MEAEPERAGRIEYVEQGFILHWDEMGLQIQVTDYHAKPLRLSWKEILSLAKVASTQGGVEKPDQ